MAYARWSDESDVYVFWSTGEYIECCGCPLTDERHWTTRDLEALAGHLRHHQDEGHTVPFDHIMERATADWHEYGGFGPEVRPAPIVAVPI